jgi:hypothetical protein
MSRPKNSNQPNLSDSIRVRLTSTQLAKLDELTLEYGLSRSLIIRELIETGRVTIHKLPELNREAIILLRKIGGLLAALLKKFPTEAADLRTLRRQALDLARYFAGEKQP